MKVEQTQNLHKTASMSLGVIHALRHGNTEIQILNTQNTHNMENLLQETKDTVAREHGYLHFAQLIQVQHNLKSDHISKVLDEAMHRFAEICCKEQVKMCWDNYRAGKGITPTPLATYKYKPQK